MARGRLVPRNYKGNVRSYDESIGLAKLPTCGWSGDSYTNWLTQNAVNEKNLDIKYNLAQLKNTLSLNFMGGFSSALDYLQSKEERFNEARLLPDKVGGSNTGNVMQASRKYLLHYNTL